MKGKKCLVAEGGFGQVRGHLPEHSLAVLGAEELWDGQWRGAETCCSRACHGMCEKRCGQQLRLGGRFPLCSVPSDTGQAARQTLACFVLLRG